MYCTGKKTPGGAGTCTDPTVEFHSFVSVIKHKGRRFERSEDILERESGLGLHKVRNGSLTHYCSVLSSEACESPLAPRRLVEMYLIW